MCHGKRAIWLPIALTIVLAFTMTALGASGKKSSAPDPKRLIPEVTLILPAPSYDPIRYEAGVLTAENWKALGLQVRVEPMDFTSLTQRMEGAPWNWDAYISGYVSRPERLDPDVLLYRPFHSSGILDGGPNASGYKSAEYDAAVEAQRSEMDPEKRRELVFKCQEILARDLPEITLYHVHEVHVYNKNKFTGFIPMTGYGNWNIWSLLSVTPLTSEKVIKVGRTADIDSTNPLVSGSGANIEVMRLIYDTLTRVGTDGKPKPWAAESWKLKDPKTILVKLRPGMKFHDGKPVTAADVKFSYDFIKKWSIPIYKPFLDPIKSIDVIDDLNLRFNLSTPFPGIYQVTFAQIYILPKHIWENVLEREGLSKPTDWKCPEPIGSGPFKFAHWRVGEETKLNAFREHFAAPKVDGLILVAFANPDALFQSLKNGDIHMHERRLLPSQIDEAKSIRHLQMVTKPDFGVYYMSFNLRRPPFNDLRFRKAIAHTIDYQTIVNTLLKGYGEAGRGMIAPANEAWHNPDAPFYEFDLGKARQILEDAGYEWDNQGRLYYPAKS